MEVESWQFNWDTATYSQGIGKKELDFGQDLDGDGIIFDPDNINWDDLLTKVETDTANSGDEGVYLFKDKNFGTLYIRKGTEDPLMIVDESLTPVTFDWKDTWGGNTNISNVFAVEGVDGDDTDTNPDFYKLAIKREFTSKDGDKTTRWETIQIDPTTGVVDWTSATSGEASPHEEDLNQDLDGDGEIWQAAKQTFTSINSDDNGVIPSLDNNNILFLQANSSADRKAVTDPVGNLVSFNTTDTFDDGKTITSAVYAAESVVIDGTETYKVLIQVTETASDGSDPVITYRTVNVDPLTMKLDWATYTSFNDPKVLEETFNEDLDNDQEITKISVSSSRFVDSDTVGAKLKIIDSTGSLFVQDGELTFEITNPDGEIASFNTEEEWDGGSFSESALAVQKVESADGDTTKDVYKLAVKETNTFGDKEDIIYRIYSLSIGGEDNSKLNISYDSVDFVTAADLNEVEFGQDLTLDGTISIGATSDAAGTFVSDVTSGTDDAEVQAKFGNTAQSDIKSISNAGASDDKIEMFVKGVDGSAKLNYEMDVKVVQEASEAVIGKLARDTGGQADKIVPLTGVLDFSVSNSSLAGEIVSVTWVLPEGTNNPKYYKKDQKTGEYFDFAYIPSLGEGYQWDEDNRTLTVYVRDNGQYDSNPVAGEVRDPGVITSSTSGSITGPSGSAGAATSSKSIKDGAQDIHTFTASSEATWSLNGGADQSLFNIDSSSGALTFIDAPDYASPLDADGNNQYITIVRATYTGDSSTSDQTVTITIDGVSPSITGLSGSSGDETSSIYLQGGSDSIGTFSSDETVTWSIDGGADAALFNIDENSGVLTFLSAPDAASPTDSDSNNEYLLNIKATDLVENSSTQSVTVIIDETTPLITGPEGSLAGDPLQQLL